MEHHHYRRFVEHLRLRNFSRRTIESYSDAVQRYFQFCRDRRIHSDSLESARTYLLYLKVDLDRAPSTVNVVYSALKRYFVDGQVAPWTIDAIPRSRRPPVGAATATRRAFERASLAALRGDTRLARTYDFHGHLRRWLLQCLL